MVDRDWSSDEAPVGDRRASSWLPTLDRRELVEVFAGGCVGTLARAALTQILPASASQWPWATFAVNILAAFLLGYVIARLQEGLPSSLYSLALLGASTCGGLSTFSTLVLELLRMLEGGHIGLAAAYGAASVGCGMVAVFVATKLASGIEEHP